MEYEPKLSPYGYEECMSWVPLKLACITGYYC
jgi:hypothetical protein